MYALSTNTSTDTWASSGWTIHPGHGLGVVDIPPPRAIDPFISNPFSSELPLTEELRLLELEEYLELMEDLASAREAEEEYKTRGIEGTISYRDYRNRRLDSASSV